MGPTSTTTMTTNDGIVIIQLADFTTMCHHRTTHKSSNYLPYYGDWSMVAVRVAVNAHKVCQHFMHKRHSSEIIASKEDSEAFCVLLICPIAAADLHVKHIGGV